MWIYFAIYVYMCTEYIQKQTVQWCISIWTVNLYMQCVFIHLSTEYTNTYIGICTYAISAVWLCISAYIAVYVYIQYGSGYSFTTWLYTQKNLERKWNVLLLRATKQRWKWIFLSHPGFSSLFLASLSFSQSLTITWYKAHCCETKLVAIMKMSHGVKCCRKLW